MMKEILTLFSVIIFVTATSAQTSTPEKINYGNRITKGTTIFTGYFNFQQSNEDRDNQSYQNNNFQFDVSGEYAFNQRYSAGLGLGYTLSKSKYDNETNNSDRKSSQFSVAPKFSTYGNIHFGWLQPSATLTIPIGFGQEENRDGKAKYTSYGASLNGGLNVFICRKLALYASLGFLNYNYKRYQDSDHSGSNFNINFKPSSIGFGLRYLVNAE